VFLAQRDEIVFQLFIFLLEAMNFLLKFTVKYLEMRHYFLQVFNCDGLLVDLLIQLRHLRLVVLLHGHPRADEITCISIALLHFKAMLLMI
jgi:hypothetical protein